MQWLQVTIETTQAGIDPVVAVLHTLGIDQLTIVDGAEEIERVLEQAGRIWDYADYAQLAAAMGGPAVQVYFDDVPASTARVEQLREQLDVLRQRASDIELGSLQVHVEKVDDSQWNTLWKEYFVPIPVGARLLIQPAWEEVPHVYAARVPVRLQNSAIFGTGQHASTQLCLQLLEDRISPDARILDLGCGSGVLFLAAQLLGAGMAVAVDVDEKAPRIVAEHAALNQIDAQRYRVVVGDVLADSAVWEAIGAERFELVTANIVADVILPLTPLVTRWIRPGGWYLLSGIVAAREAEMVSVLRRHGFTVAQTARADDWVAIAAQHDG